MTRNEYYLQKAAHAKAKFDKGKKKKDNKKGPTQDDLEGAAITGGPTTGTFSAVGGAMSRPG